MWHALSPDKKVKDVENLFKFPPEVGCVCISNRRRSILREVVECVIRELVFGRRWGGLHCTEKKFHDLWGAAFYVRAFFINGYVNYYKYLICSSKKEDYAFSKQWLTHDWKCYISDSGLMFMVDWAHVSSNFMLIITLEIILWIGEFNPMPDLPQWKEYII